MKPEHWDDVLELFNRLLEIPPRHRRAGLTQLAGPDGAIRRELESLLDAYEREPDYLERPLARVGDLSVDRLAAELDTTDDDAHPERVGRYRLVERIGDGGMGAVWLAERDDQQFHHRVAIKLVKRGMDSEEIVRRFRAERQILASLDHPNIARLFDGGAADDGRPYVVMEYVRDGIPIDRYCDRRKLDVPARLRLFRTVCSAVHYAHQNLVVHRDLKPGNILISDSGDVKLLDFGIAKILDPGSSGVPVTRTEMRMMTPEYASPEQILGQPVTTASDVYALGVLLYELLSGHRPYRVRGRSPGEIERVICQEEPDRPSTIVGRTEQAFGTDGRTRHITPASVSAARATRSDRLRRELDGDLDNVVMMAMRKDPLRRYPSVAALSEDVRRHIAGEPVLARADSRTYRMGKFVRRHRLSVAAASTLFASVSGFGVVMALQSRRIARQARELTRERDKARSMVHFLEELFKVSDPTTAQGGQITARELLEGGIAKMRSELESQPEVQAELMTVAADVLANLGVFDRADALLEENLAIRQRLEDDGDAVATTMAKLGRIRQVRGEYEVAEQLLTSALEIQQRLHGGDGVETAGTINELGIVLRKRGDHAGAEQMFRRSLALRRSHLEADDVLVAESLNNLGLIRRFRGDLDEAEWMFREALAIQRRQLGARNTTIAYTLNNLAVLLRARGELDSSEALDREALDIRREALDVHPDVAQSLNNLGSLMHRRGDFETAERLFGEALDMWSGLLAADHPEMANALFNLGQVCRALDRSAEALELLERAREIQLRRLGADHPALARTVHYIGELHRIDERHEQALEAFRAALEIRETRLGSDHRQTAATRLSLGVMLEALGDAADAAPMIERAAEILGTDDMPASPGSAEVARSLRLYGGWLVGHGRPEEAVDVIHRSLDGWLRMLDADHPEVHITERELASALAAAGRVPEAVQYVSPALASLRSRLGERHRETMRTAAVCEQIVAMTVTNGVMGTNSSGEERV